MATLKKTKNSFKTDHRLMKVESIAECSLLLDEGQMYCRINQSEHSAILSTFIKLPFAIKILILSIFEWPFYTGFTVGANTNCSEIT